MPNIYQGPGMLYSTRDMQQVNPFTSTLARLTQENADAQSQQNLAAMAAERMRALGPQGEQWAAMIQRDPRAALAMMEQYGGPSEIENSILGAKAQGEAQLRWNESLQRSELSPEELQILREGGPIEGPKALKAYREAMSGGEAAAGPASYTTADGVFIRDPSAPGGYRNAGKPKQSGGMQLEFDENGRVVGFSMGGGGITNTSRARVEEKAFNAQNVLSRLDQIGEAFNPDFLTWGGKARIAVLQARSAAGQQLPAEDVKRLGDFATFKVSAFNNMNRILNELSGAAISPAEAERLKQELPNPGTGIFDGDDAVTFKAKMEAVERQTREAISLYDSQLQRTPPPETSSAKPAARSAQPLPPKDQLVTGEVYETRHGPAEWDGQQFNVVK